MQPSDERSFERSRERKGKRPPKRGGPRLMTALRDCEGVVWSQTLCDSFSAAWRRMSIWSEIDILSATSGLSLSSAWKV